MLAKSYYKIILTILFVSFSFGQVGQLRVGFDIDPWEYKEGDEGDLVRSVLEELNKEKDEDE